MIRQPIQVFPKTRGPSKPVRSLSEMAGEFGVSESALTGYAKNYPLPKLVLERRGHRKALYLIADLRAWWASIPKRAA